MEVEERTYYTVYREGQYWVEVIGKDIYMRHNCSYKTECDPDDDHDWYNALPESEIEANECQYCGKLDVPADLLALYKLYKYGNQ